MNIMGYELIETSCACPEQYDVLKDGKLVGYLRLRHGFFQANYPNCCGTTVYTANTKGDGIFHPSEREMHLRLAITAIDECVKGLTNA
jgi:hypothetical protein